MNLRSYLLVVLFVFVLAALAVSGCAAAQAPPDLQAFDVVSPALVEPSSSAVALGATDSPAEFPAVGWLVWSIDLELGAELSAEPGVGARSILRAEWNLNAQPATFVSELVIEAVGYDEAPIVTAESHEGTQATVAFDGYRRQFMTELPVLAPGGSGSWGGQRYVGSEVTSGGDVVAQAWELGAGAAPWARDITEKTSGR